MTAVQPTTPRSQLNQRAHINASSTSWMPITAMIDVGHSQLAYRRIGSGPDVVFVHGWPLHSATFRDMLPLLSSKYTCHLFDLPGTGDSVWDEGSRISMRAHAASLRDAINQLGLTRYAMVAHDSGGLIARLIAQNNDAVVGLTMGNTETPNHHPWQVMLYTLVGKMPGGSAVFRTLMRSRTFRRSPLGFGGCFDDVNVCDGAFHEHFAAPVLTDDNKLAGQMRLLAGLETNLLSELPQVHRAINAPVQLIWGKNDGFFTLERAQAMLPEFAGGASLVELPGKLFVHEERPEEFCAAMAPFLRQAFNLS